MNNISLKELESLDCKVTPEMLFGPDTDGSDLPKIEISDLKSLLEKSPEESSFELFLKEHAVGIPFPPEMLKAGLEYIRSGCSVIPVGADKRPLINWKIYQKQKATEDDFLKWLTTFKDMQIGIVTGKISDLIVVDIDNPKIDLSWLPETAVSKTGSGGFHYFYSFVEGFGNKTRIKDFVDIRAEGGYILAPPSRNLKGNYEWIKKIKPTPFPIDLFQKKEEVTQSAQTIFDSQVETDYPGYSQGQRNGEMTKYIGHILARVHPKEWETLAFPVIQTANKKNNPPLSDWELDTTFKSICSREKRNNAQRWYNQGGATTSVAQPPEQKINLVVKADYKKRYTWGTEGLDEKLAVLKRGNFVIVGAKRSSGKTTYTFDMACKNAILGHKVLYVSLEMDEQKIKEDFARKYAGITITEEYHYKIPEEKQTAFEKKIKEMESINNLFFKGMRRGGGTVWGDVLKIINEFDELDLIVIDNLDLIDEERGETNNDRQKRITKRIMNFTEEFKIPLILIHHHRKSSQSKDFGSDELSGSGKIGDNADIILKIKRNLDLNAAYPEKYQSFIEQQKGRGYPNVHCTVYFLSGTFEDFYSTVETNKQQKKVAVQNLFME